MSSSHVIVFCVISNLILKTTLGGSYNYYSHFNNKKSEAPGDEVTGSEPPTCKCQNQDTTKISGCRALH